MLPQGFPERNANCVRAVRLLASGTSNALIAKPRGMLRFSKSAWRMVGGGGKQEPYAGEGLRRARARRPTAAMFVNGRVLPLAIATSEHPMAAMASRADAQDRVPVAELCGEKQPEVGAASPLRSSTSARRGQSKRWRRSSRASTYRWWSLRTRGEGPCCCGGTEWSRGPARESHLPAAYLEPTIDGPHQGDCCM
jgi:hypothetical protein